MDRYPSGFQSAATPGLGIQQGVAASNNAYDTIAREQPLPGTLPALMIRLEQLMHKASAVCAHSYEVRVGLTGAYPELNDSKPSAPKAVPNGFIERANDMLDMIQHSLVAADEQLEVVYSKIGP